MEITLTLIALGLIFHQMIYVSSNGWKHFTDVGMNFIYIGQKPTHKLLLNLSLVLFCLLVICNPKNHYFIFGLFFSLLILIAFFPKRVSNHLILSLFSIASYVLIDNQNERIWVLQSITIILYFCVFFHKLNRDYFTKNCSIGYGVVIHYMIQRFSRTNFKEKNLIFYISTYFIVISEFIIFLLLFIGNYTFVAILLALVLHFAFGYLAHYHFSTIMLGLLMSFIPSINTSDLLITFKNNYLLITTLSIMSLIIFSNHRAYINSRVSFIGNAIFSLVFWIIYFSVFNKYPVQYNIFYIPQSHTAISIIFLAVLNGISPYIGIKNEFSFAMFSNLHPIYYTHFIIRKRLLGNLFVPRYYKIINYKIINESKNKLAYESFSKFISNHSGEYLHVRILHDWKKDLERLKIPYYIICKEKNGKEISLASVQLKIYETILLFPVFIPSNPKIPYFL